MTSLLRPVTALLVSAAILLLGNGLVNVLLPIRAELDGFTGIDIGIMGSVYYVGLMAGCFATPAIIGRAGHIRAFTAFTATATSAPLLMAIFSDPVAWWALRALLGFCFAGLFMGIESWLSAASTEETRGRVLGVYTLLNLTVATVGMQMLGVADAKGFELFSLVAILYSLAAVPVALTQTPAPSSPRSSRLRLGRLVAVSPSAVAGCFFSGVANGAFWMLSPIYAQGAGLGVGEVAAFLSTAILAGAATQWPIGYVSDHLGRRPIAAAIAVLAAGAGLGLYLATGGGRPLLFALAGLWGAAAFAIYTLCIAHANDLISKQRAVEVSGGLLLVFSFGAIAGPTVAAYAMSSLGPGALFLHCALAHVLIALVMLLRARLRPELPEQHHEEFGAVPSTTPAVFELDPRGDSVEPAEDELAFPPS